MPANLGNAWHMMRLTVMIKRKAATLRAALGMIESVVQGQRRHWKQTDGRTYGEGFVVGNAPGLPKVLIA
jgi:hypothetical protein